MIGQEELIALNAHITNVADQMKDRSKASGRNLRYHDGNAGFLFTGSPDVSVPTCLLSDANIDSTGIHGWITLRQSAIDARNQGFLMSRDELATEMRVSKPTATRVRSMLRASRWITKCQSVKEGKYLGDIYLLHSEPLSLQDTLAIDHEYVTFIEHTQQNPKSHKLLRACAAGVLKELDTTPETPRSVLDQIKARLSPEATSPLHAAPTNQLQPFRVANQPRVKNFDAEKTDSNLQVKNFNVDERPEIRGSQDSELRVKNFDAGEENFSCLSSISSSVSSSYISPTKNFSQQSPIVKAEQNDPILSHPVITEYRLTDAESLTRFQSVIKPIRRYWQTFEQLIRPLAPQAQREVVDVMLSHSAAAQLGARSQIRNSIAYIRHLVNAAKQQTLVVDDLAEQLNQVRQGKQRFFDAIENMSPTPTESVAISRGQATEMPARPVRNATPQAQPSAYRHSPSASAIDNRENRRRVHAALTDIMDFNW